MAAFMDELAVRLDRILEREKLDEVMRSVSDILSGYNIEKKVTALEVVEGLPQCAKAYLVVKKLEGRAAGTLYLYRIYLEDIFRTMGKPVDLITTNDLRLYLYELKERRGISERTLDRRRVVLNCFFV